MGRYISFAVLLGIIVVIGVLFYKVMIGFFVPVFLAAILVVVFRPLHRWVLAKVGEREHIAAGVTSTLIILAVLLPTALVISLAAVQGSKLFENFNSASIQIGLSKLRSNKLLNLESPCATQLRTIHEKVDMIKVNIFESKDFQVLVASKGIVAGNSKEIRNQLKDLTPRLIEYTKDKFLHSIGELRSRSGSISPEELEKYRSETNECFAKITDQIESLRLSMVGESEDKRQGLLNEALQTKPYAVALLNPNEQTLLEETRKTLLARSVEWHKAIAKVNNSLDSLLPSLEGNPRGDEDLDIISLQKSVIVLVNDWQDARDSISGGKLMAFLKDVANPSSEQIRELTQSGFEYIRPRLLSFTGDSFAFLFRLIVGCSILMTALYFFLYDGPGIVRSMMELSPLDDRYELELLAEFDRISRAIVLATLLSALMQGLTAGVGYYVVSLWVSLDSLLLLTVLTVTCALIPFIGPAIVWVPVCLYLLVYKEAPVAAGALALWGMLVVGTVDNVVKMFVLHGQSQLHPLLALLSVLGGIQSLGPIGILVGPMVVTLLQTLLGILRNELTQFRKSDEPVASDEESDSIKHLSGWIRKVKMSTDLTDEELQKESSSSANESSEQVDAPELRQLPPGAPAT